MILRKSPSGNPRFDAIVVGAGPAGSTTAAQLGRSGLRVALVDRCRFPRSKVCGEYMSPQALSILDRLGVLEEVLGSGARRLTGLTLRSSGGSCFRGDYTTVDDHAPYLPHGLAVRREILDAILLEKAASVPGVTCIEELSIRELLIEGGKVRGVRGHHRGQPLVLEAPLVVGADGTRSLVARASGLGKPPRGLVKFALRAYYSGLADENRGELWVGKGCYAGLAPVDGGLTNLNLVVDHREITRRKEPLEAFLERTLSAIPGLPERIRGGVREGRIQGTGPMAWGCKSPVADGVVLVGDAVGFVDPFTGEGIFLALRSAEMAAEEIVPTLARGGPTAKALSSYARRRRELDRKLSACMGVQKLLYRSRIFDWAIERLGRDHDLIARVLAVSGDYLPLRGLLNTGTIFRLLTGIGATSPARALRVAPVREKQP